MIYLAQHVILTIQCQIGNINKKIHIHYQFYGSEIQNSIFRGKELPDDHHGKTMNKLCKLQHSHLECRWGKRKLPAFSYNLCYRYTPCHHHPPKLNQLPANWINEKANDCQHFNHSVLGITESIITIIKSTLSGIASAWSQLLVMLESQQAASFQYRKVHKKETISL